MLKHGGKIRQAAVEYGIEYDQWLDLSTGINPNGWIPPMIPAKVWNRLPEDNDGLLSAAAHYYGCSSVLATAGSQASIQLLPHCLELSITQGVIGLLSVTYNEHAFAWKQAGFKVEELSFDAFRQLDETSLSRFAALIIVNPNNPTADSVSLDKLLALHKTLAANDGYLIVDEAFMDCTPENSLVKHCPQQGLIVLRSLGKFFGLAGVRLGFAFADDSMLSIMQNKLGPWTVSHPTRFIAKMALADFSWHEKTRERLKIDSLRLNQLLSNFGLKPDGSHFLFQWLRHNNAKKIHHQLAQQGVFCRLFEPSHSLRFGLPAIEDDWNKLEQALQQLAITKFSAQQACAKIVKHQLARTLMVQGTTSDAGKSILVTGLCRVLKRQGFKVAPFKPQNMALNSCVSVDGGEIGRAQALQAEACGIKPHSDMNPVLLKPNSDCGAQVIIHGKAVANMRAKQYQDYKKHAKKAVLTSHQHLQSHYDTIIVEGAGSPAEINLRRGDIANMGFAEAVDCPVILVADIDRGGVFAHLVGTLELLSASERARIKGFVINRFRGDISLLKPGLDWLEEKTSKPVLGVLPYLKDLYLDAEDSVEQRQIKDGNSTKLLNIVVPLLPRISNHNDFDPLRLHPQVNIQFIALNQTMPACDLIILPGSKSVRDDLAQLTQHGWQQHIQQHLRYGGKLMGICAGFQMLGQQVHDPLGCEGEAGSSQGLGYLELETTLSTNKQLNHVCATLAKSSAAITGYEIHTGVTTGAALQHPVILLENGQTDGAYSSDGRIMGTYLHGLFETASACQAILEWARLKINQKPTDYATTRNDAIDRLADSIEQHLDMTKITQLLEALDP